MFCSKCGSELKKGVAFCGKCGKKVEKFTTKQNVTNQKTSTQNIKVIEIEEEEKTIESLTSNGMIYTVVALTMILSFGFIIICSLI